jgi:DNA-binding IclR family transcriptional regulator
VAEESRVEAGVGGGGVDSGAVDEVTVGSSIVVSDRIVLTDETASAGSAVVDAVGSILSAATSASAKVTLAHESPLTSR